MTHASVFSGIGGSEVAATMLGWENLFHCEINPFGRQVLDYWYPNSKSYEDITTTDATEFGFATPNLRSFVRGCPRTPAEPIQHLRELKATLNDAIRDEKQRMKNGKQNNPY